MEARICEAFDPVPIPSPDWFPRTVAYEKPWGQLSVGRVVLEEGLINVSVKAIEFPGKQAMDLKSVQLRQTAAGNA